MALIKMDMVEFNFATQYEASVSMLLQQWEDFAEAQGVTADLFGGVINNFTNPQLANPVYSKLVRYCNPLVRRLLQNHTYYPRSFFYEHNLQRFAVQIRIPQGENLFTGARLQETHHQEVMFEVKDQWTNMKTIWSNFVMLFYLDKMSEQLLETLSFLPEGLRYKFKSEFHLEDVTDLIDKKNIDQLVVIKDIVTTVRGNYPELMGYVSDLMEHPVLTALLNELTSFTQSLDPHSLPRVLHFPQPESLQSLQQLYIYPECEPEEITPWSVWLPNMFLHPGDCKLYKATDKQTIKLGYRRYRPVDYVLKNLLSEFDGFVPRFVLPSAETFLNEDTQRVALNNLSDHLQQIMGVFVMQKSDNIYHCTFTVYRGRDGDRKQRAPPAFLLFIVNVDPLTITNSLYLLPKHRKLPSSIVNNWQNKTYDIQTFPLVKFYFSKTEIVKSVLYGKLLKFVDDTRPLLLNIVWLGDPSLYFLREKIHFPEAFPQLYNDFIYTHLIDFLPLNPQPDFKKILDVLKNNTISFEQTIMYTVELNKIKTFETNLGLSTLQIDNNARQTLHWKEWLQELSHLLVRYICVFYVDFTTPSFTFEVLNPVGKVRKASHYVLVYLWKGKIHMHLLFPEVPELSDSIITNWKKGFDSTLDLYENVKLAREKATLPPTPQLALPLYPVPLDNSNYYMINKNFDVVQINSNTNDQLQVNMFQLLDDAVETSKMLKSKWEEKSDELTFEPFKIPFHSYICETQTQLTEFLVDYTVKGEEQIKYKQYVVGLLTKKFLQKPETDWNLYFNILSNYFKHLICVFYFNNIQSDNNTNETSIDKKFFVFDGGDPSNKGPPFYVVLNNISHLFLFPIVEQLPSSLVPQWLGLSEK